MSARNDPTKDGPEDFGRYVGGYAQQRVSGAFELDHIPRPFLNSLLRFAYGADVDLAARAVRLTSVSRRGILRDAFTYVEGARFRSLGSPVTGLRGNGAVGTSLDLDRHVVVVG